MHQDAKHQQVQHIEVPGEPGILMVIQQGRADEAHRPQGDPQDLLFVKPSDDVIVGRAEDHQHPDDRQ